MKTERLYQGLYQIWQQVVEQEDPVYLVGGLIGSTLRNPTLRRLKGERGTQGHASGIG
jgi:hypothetical protein